MNLQVRITRFILSEKERLFVYRGDRYPIGMTTTDEKKNFTNQIVDIRPGDMIYMCTDGYADQFGSDEVKKYKSANVKKLLASDMGSSYA